MTERSLRMLRRVVRIVSLALAAGFAAWAISDDTLIGGAEGFGATQAAVLGVGLVVAASCLLPLGWNARVLALVISISLVSVMAELVLEVMFAHRHRAENEFDPQLLYRPVPGALRESVRGPINGGDRILYRINSDGYRGDELEPDPAARVAVYGDSFVHGYYSTLENTFAKRLELRLSEGRARKIEVVNGGVAGYGPDQALLKMERELPRLRPDLVLVAIFSGNDFGDPVRNKLFRLDEQGDLRANDFSVSRDLLRQMELNRNESVLKRMIRDAVQPLLVGMGLRSEPSGGVESMSPHERIEFFLAQHLAEYDEYVVRGDNVVRELGWDSYDADVSLTPNSDAARYKIALVDAILGRMQAAAASVGAPLVLLPIPHPVDLDGHPTGEVDRAKYPDYQPRGLVSILERIAERRGIPCIDLYGEFARHDTAEIYFRGFDDHWNDAGQDLAAALVVRELAARSLLDGLVARSAESAERGR